jgi:hypothetical protein
MIPPKGTFSVAQNLTLVLFWYRVSGYCRDGRRATTFLRHSSLRKGAGLCEYLDHKRDLRFSRECTGFLQWDRLIYSDILQFNA